MIKFRKQYKSAHFVRAWKGFRLEEVKSYLFARSCHLYLNSASKKIGTPPSTTFPVRMRTYGGGGPLLVGELVVGEVVTGELEDGKLVPGEAELGDMVPGWLVDGSIDGHVVLGEHVVGANVGAAEIGD